MTTARRNVSTSTAGIRVLVDWLKEHDVSEAAYEPVTGGYERQLVRQLDEAGLIPRMVHPFRMMLPRPGPWVRGEDRRSRRTGPLAVRPRLSHGGHATGQARPGAGPNCATCCGARRQLVNQRVQELNRLDKGITKGSRVSTKRHIAWLDDEIARNVDEEYKKALQSSSHCPVGLPFTRVFRAWEYSPRLSLPSLAGASRR